MTETDIKITSIAKDDIPWDARGKRQRTHIIHRISQSLKTLDPEDALALNFGTPEDAMKVRTILIRWKFENKMKFEMFRKGNVLFIEPEEE